MGLDRLEGPILITGGCGFLGQHLANDLVHHGFEVILFDIRPDRSLLDDHAGTENPEVVAGDVLSFSELLDVLCSKKARTIIHAAAIIPPASDLRPHYSIRVNVLGTCNVLEAARVLRLGRITSISSGAVYDPSRRCVEDSPIPLGPGFGMYGSAKACSELIGLKYAQLYGVDFVSARNAVIYGPGVTSPHYLNVLATNAVGQTKTELKSGGDHRFEFVYVRDAVKGIRMIHTAPHLKYRIYNVGTGQMHSLFQLADKIQKLIPGVEISLGPGLLEESKQRGAFDISRLKEIGYHPEFDLDRGLEEFIRALQNRRPNGRDH